MKKISREEREQYLVSWKASGKPVKQFCSEHGLNHYTFYGWLEGQRKKPATGQAFIEVSIPEVSSALSTPIALWCGPYRIELVRGFDPECLKDVLEVLGAIHVC